MSLALEFQHVPTRLTVSRRDPLCTLLFDGPAPNTIPRLLRRAEDAEAEGVHERLPRCNPQDQRYRKRDRTGGHRQTS